ncbi:MAG: hypothetical protein NT045_05680, partial [Candidatus Aureabacteria bacterium]|nr:hypothetical protein [Candidatus Auribacterota bacterium]
MERPQLIAWLITGGAFTGCGLWIRRLFRLRIKGLDCLITAFWLGWAANIFFLQAWHLFFKINATPLFLACTVGGAGLLYNARDILSLFSKGRFDKAFYCLILLLIAVWIANHAILAPSDYDSGLYHLASLQWAKTFPITAGLVNLHGRLAFNSSHFLYAAMLDIHTHGLIVRSWHIANGLLLLALFSQILLNTFRLFLSRQGPRLYHIFFVLLIPPAMRGVMSIYSSNISPDLPAYILSFLISMQVLQFLENFHDHPEEKRYNLFYVCALVCVGIVIKLNFFVFGLSALILSVALWIGRKEQNNACGNKKVITCIAICWCVGIIPWMLRGVILSGFIA